MPPAFTKRLTAAKRYMAFITLDIIFCEVDMRRYMALQRSKSMTGQITVPLIASFRRCCSTELDIEHSCIGIIRQILQEFIKVFYSVCIVGKAGVNRHFIYAKVYRKDLLPLLRVQHNDMKQCK